ncbi:MAG: type IX secretion system membrane protein PorP/SprF [Flavobacteriales bacterium]|jgi:type IX secretion system PorP/SprF family membrane protein
MKRNIYLLSALVLLLAATATGQQLGRTTQFALNPYLVNPAYAGTQNAIPMYITYRNQWAGFKGAPVTMTASGHMQGPRNSGFGAILQRDDTGGAISRTGLEATGSYRVDLNGYDGISFGLGLSANQFKVDNSKLVVMDETDVALNGMQVESTFNIDANFGMLVYGDDYYFGFSSPNLIQSKLKVSGVNADDNRNARHYHIVGSYRYDITEDFDIQPSGLFRFTNNTPPQIDMNVRVGYQQMAWSSISWRLKDAIALSVGGTYENFVLAYAMDISTGKARIMSPFTHELIVGYVIPGKRGKYIAGGGSKKKALSKKRIIKIK